jgi:hypothetical protein
MEVKRLEIYLIENAGIFMDKDGVGCLKKGGFLCYIMAEERGEKAIALAG